MEEAATPVDGVNQTLRRRERAGYFPLEALSAQTREDGTGEKRSETEARVGGGGKQWRKRWVNQCSYFVYSWVQDFAFMPWITLFKDMLNKIGGLVSRRGLGLPHFPISYLSCCHLHPGTVLFLQCLPSPFKKRFRAPALRHLISLLLPPTFLEASI
ncbi:hypothetical protein KSP39_PZI020873 [Platanthera zijinensis]|uniref:Uncharacterized protein n=1 Tax=Platanthera zijinensis TaxID=2320716 RepID=A0AAP0FXC6_9ASPA